MLSLLMLIGVMRMLILWLLDSVKKRTGEDGQLDFEHNKERGPIADRHQTMAAVAIAQSCYMQGITLTLALILC
jgi:hypothetical protein